MPRPTPSRRTCRARCRWRAPPSRAWRRRGRRGRRVGVVVRPQRRHADADQPEARAVDLALQQVGPGGRCGRRAAWGRHGRLRVRVLKSAVFSFSMMVWPAMWPSSAGATPSRKAAAAPAPAPRARRYPRRRSSRRRRSWSRSRSDTRARPSRATGARAAAHRAVAAHQLASSMLAAGRPMRGDAVARQRRAAIALPTPQMMRTGCAARNGTASASPITAKPRGLSRSEAILARNLL